MNTGHKVQVVLGIIMAVGMLFLFFELIEIALNAFKIGNIAGALFTIPVFGLWIFAEWYIIGSTHYEATQCPVRN